MTDMTETTGKQTKRLPGPLPPGEVLLWQGAPAWWTLARRALHIHQVAAYFAVLLVWSIGSAVWQHSVDGSTIIPALLPLPLALGALGMLALFAWLAMRTTTYSITNRRVVMHFGVALPMTVNIPFRVINAAAVSCGTDGSGDVALSLSKDAKLAYLIMWPHARPWRFSRPEPSLRGIPDAAGVAQVLSRALAASAAQPVAAAPSLSVPSRDSVAAHPAAA